VSGDNYHDVVSQIEDIGVVWRDARDLPLKIDSRRHTCGRGGKYWYKLHKFLPDAGGEFITGSFGSYKEGVSHKVVVDWTPLKEAERERWRAQRLADEAKAKAERERLQAEAAMSAAQLWHTGSKTGRSAYLERKGVQPEACRFMGDGSILVPLLRYDAPRDQALKGIQRIWGNGRKSFTKDLPKTGCALRLGQVEDPQDVMLMCEGYATGLSIRMAIDHQLPVFVALDCYNLQAVLEVVRYRYPWAPLLICADDDYRTQGNPGRALAKKAAKATRDCSFVWPVFPAGLVRGDKDTDFNDLHRLGGVHVVTRQLAGVLDMMRRRPNGR
jgi:putative DNA primase/helicase